jgi:O-antigen/teichoic acid export membrane protein
VPAPTLPTLRGRVVRASAWTVVGYGLSTLLRLGSNLLMARLLMPEMFGVIAIASMVMYGLAMVSDIGLGPSIVQSKRGRDPLFLNTAWTVQIRRGVLIWLAALAASLIIGQANRVGIVPAASVYANQQLPYIIAVLSLGAVVSGFESTKLFEASRNLAIRQLTQIELSSQVIALLCMLTWVAFDRSIWALVAGALGGSVARTILSHMWLPGVANRWEWDNAALREIVHFGKWIFLSSILGFLVNSGDRILLGGMLSLSTLGVYAIAILVVNSVESLLVRFISDVTFPALSEVARDRLGELKVTYYHFHIVIAYVTFFISGLLIVSGHTLVAILYDHRYDQAGWMVQLLAVGLLTIPYRVATQCFMALGKPRLLSNIIMTRLVALFTITPIGFHFFGTLGALCGIVFSSFISLPLTILYAVEHRLFDLRKECSVLLMLLTGIIVGKLVNLAFGH